MSHHWTQHRARSWKILTGFSLALSLAACTDGRPPRKEVQLVTTAPPVGTTLQLAADVKFGGKPTDALQMLVKGGSLFLTGRPFGFSRWEIAQDAENPAITFAASDQIDTFSPMGTWVVDWYSSGALAVWNSVAFLSGTKGTSVVNMSQTTKPLEVQRYPTVDPNADQVASDEAFIYSAIVTHPTLSLMYGFRRQDYVYSVDISQGKLSLAGRDAYGGPGETVCCVMGATIFENTLYVAFRDRLIFFDLGADGRLGAASEVNQLNAVNVVSTSRYLYVQHEPTAASSAGKAYQSGIYVFDKSGANVAFFKASSPRRFAVSSDDAHFFANIDGTSVKVYRIQWTN